MILSVRDLPAIRIAIDNLYRVTEHPDATNQVACDVFREWSGGVWLDGQSPAEVVSAGFILAAIEEVMKKLGHHTRDECPEITKSDLDLQTKAVLLSLRDDLRTPLLSHFLATNDRVRTLFLVELTGTLGKLDGSSGVTHAAPPVPPAAPPVPPEARGGKGDSSPDSPRRNLDELTPALAMAYRHYLQAVATNGDGTTFVDLFKWCEVAEHDMSQWQDAESWARGVKRALEKLGLPKHGARGVAVPRSAVPAYHFTDRADCTDRAD